MREGEGGERVAGAVLKKAKESSQQQVDSLRRGGGSEKGYVFVRWPSPPGPLSHVLLLSSDAIREEAL